jgi:hypothetical protein
MHGLDNLKTTFCILAVHYPGYSSSRQYDSEIEETSLRNYRHLQVSNRIYNKVGLLWVTEHFPTGLIRFQASESSRRKTQFCVCDK